MKVQLFAGAQLDLSKAIAFYRQSDPATAGRFIVAIDDHLKLIAKHPERAPMAAGRSGPTEFRRLKVQGFPFGILYRVRDEVVQVMAFAHERRRPTYWVKR